MLWSPFLQSLSSKCSFCAPASSHSLAETQLRLKVNFPPELVGLLSASNGVYGEYNLGLVWPVERILADNVSFRTNPDFQDLYLPFACLLFFGDAGNGDQFAFSIRNGVIHSPEVFAWNHEDDSRIWVAPSLQKYFDWWLSGKIKI